VRKLIPALLLLSIVTAGACRRAAPPATSASTAAMPASGNLIGAESANAALTAFLQAAKGQNLQAMSSLWGTPTELLREVDTQDNVEKRLLIMICHLKHDRVAVSNERASTGGARTFDVALTLGSDTRRFRIGPAAGSSRSSSSSRCVRTARPGRSARRQRPPSAIGEFDQHPAG
jgi:hypothetical protein